MKKSMVLFGIISIIVFACSPKEKVPAEELDLVGVKFQQLSLAEGKELALRQNKLILIDFFSPG